MPSSMDNQITIEIDGINFEDFETGNISRDFSNFCGSFNFKASKDKVNDFAIDAQSYCNIYVNGIKAMTGVIDKVEPSEEPEGSEVNISGRDITCDLVDSSLPAPIMLSGDFDLVTVIEKVLEVFSLKDTIKVINKIPDLRKFTSADVISSEEDKNAFEFMNDYAQKVSAILVTDEDGNIVITRAGEETVRDQILNVFDNEENNVLSSSASYDFSQRFYQYIVISQSNSTTAKTEINASNVSCKGVAYDTEVRKSRTLVIKAENACDSETCTDIATLEANVRRANSLKYNCSVAGYQLNSGKLYSTNIIMTVIDDDVFIEAPLLVKAVSFSFGDGSITDLEFATPDAYTLQANLDEVDARTSQLNKKKQKSKKSKKGKTGKQASKEEMEELNKLLGL